MNVLSYVDYVPDAPLLTYKRCSTDQPSTQHESEAWQLLTSATVLLYPVQISSPNTNTDALKA